MRAKPTRKNARKERIFSLRQNIQDFDYLKDYRAKGRNKRQKSSAEQYR